MSQEELKLARPGVVLISTAEMGVPRTERERERERRKKRRRGMEIGCMSFFLDWLWLAFVVFEESRR